MLYYKCGTRLAQNPEDDSLSKQGFPHQQAQAYAGSQTSIPFSEGLVRFLVGLLVPHSREVYKDLQRNRRT